MCHEKYQKQYYLPLFSLANAMFVLQAADGEQCASRVENVFPLEKHQSIIQLSTIKFDFFTFYNIPLIVSFNNIGINIINTKIVKDDSNIYIAIINIVIPIFILLI